jgi:iron complex transport system ATP-binding protein
MSAALWSLRSVGFHYSGAARTTVDDATFDIETGEVTAVIGPNGAGKSTLLRLLLGALKPASGTVTFDGRPLDAWPRRELALAVGVVPQEETEPIFTVREIVAMGRYPRLGPWRREGPVDRAATERAMERSDVARFRDRWISTLSGGEQQRVRLARALAQEPRALVLDEPTAFLDVRHEMTTFELLRGLRAEGTTVVLVTHNINLAARYADTLVLMANGRIAAQGRPVDVLIESSVAEIYEWPVSIVACDDGAPQVLPKSRGGR